MLDGLLAFNIGPRFCAGAPLARALPSRGRSPRAGALLTRAEAYEALDALLTRLPTLRLDPASDRPHLRGFLQRGYKPLHVVFDPA